MQAALNRERSVMADFLQKVGFDPGFKLKVLHWQGRESVPDLAMNEEIKCREWKKTIG